MYVIEKDELKMFTRVMAQTTRKMGFLVTGIWKTVGEAVLFGDKYHELRFGHFRFEMPFQMEMYEQGL